MSFGLFFYDSLKLAQRNGASAVSQRNFVNERSTLKVGYGSIRAPTNQDTPDHNASRAVEEGKF